MLITEFPDAAPELPLSVPCPYKNMPALSIAISESFFNIDGERKSLCIDKINNTRKEIFLSNDEEKIVESFYEEFSLGKVETGEAISEEEEIQNKLNMSIPILNGGDLFKYRPQSSPCFLIGIRPPILNGNEILYEINLFNISVEQINKEIEHIKSTIKGNVNNLNSDINVFNIQLKDLIKQKVKGKIEEIKKASGVISKLNIKLKRRADAPKTYVLPIKKKKIVLSTSKISTENPSALEPKLADETYEEILKIMKNMSK